MTIDYKTTPQKTTRHHDKSLKDNTSQQKTTPQKTSRQHNKRQHDK